MQQRFHERAHRLFPRSRDKLGVPGRSPGSCFTGRSAFPSRRAGTVADRSVQRIHSGGAALGLHQTSLLLERHQERANHATNRKAVSRVGIVHRGKYRATGNLFDGRPPSYTVIRHWVPNMLRYLLILLPLAAWAATIQVEVRDSEVWLIQESQPKQLTHDGKAKLRVLLSPAGDRVAYSEQCPQSEECIPAVVILDLDGKRLGSVQPVPQSDTAVSPCMSILAFTWAGENGIAVECHINPSLSEYFETEIATGQTTRDLLGYDFTPSPDGKRVAHVGWIPHFAPPFAQSNYLQLDHLTIYPLPEGTQPVEQDDLAGPPEVVQEQDSGYSGIHAFKPGLRWSPDSQHVALIDCTYDWTMGQPAPSAEREGIESNRHCAVAVIAASGEFKQFPLPDSSISKLGDAQLSWAEPHELRFQMGGSARTFEVPQDF